MDSSPSQNAGKLPLLSSIAGGLTGDITVPGDKSISHRALMLSSQTLGTTRITGLLEGDDVLNTAKALRELGVIICHHDKGWDVHGVGIGGLSESGNVLDLGNSGTSTRLLMGLVTPYPFTTFFTGDNSLRSRPMARAGVEVVARMTSASSMPTWSSFERVVAWS